ncbi:MAG: histidine kinase dimerization/phospho-acceptor domain-containing protein [Myxococcota bacterium]
MTRGSGMLGRVAFVVVAAGLVVLGVAVSVVVTLVVDDKKAGLQDGVLNAAALRAERLEARLALAEAELAHLAGDLLAGRVEDAVRQATVGLADAVLATVDGAELVEASRDEAALAALRGWSGTEARGLAGPYVAVAVTREHVRVRGVVSWTPRALPEGWRLTVDEGAPVTALTARREGDAAVARAPVAPGLALRLEAPLGPARAAVGRLAWRVVAWSSFALVPLLVLAWVLSRAVTSPLRRLAQAVGGWNEGKALDPGPLPRNEIGELGDAIGAMSARVHADATALRAAVRFGRGARSDDTPAGVLGALRGVLRDALPGWRVVRPAEHQERAFDAARRPDGRGFGASLVERESEPSSVRLTLPGGGETIAVEDDGVVVGAVENVLPSPPAELRLARLFARTAEARLRIARLARKSRAQAKLASAGKLAAAVTHEMNTPLAYLQANLETLGEALGPAHRELVEDSLLGVARLTRILQDLSATTAGGSLGAFEATDLRAVAGDVLRMAETRG